MTPVKTGAKGFALEEVLKKYFSRSGYVAIRGVPYKVGGEEVTDIDLWLYERPGAATRRRIIVDVKNRKSPRAAERIIWTKGLQTATSVDTAIVATRATSASIKRLAKAVGVVLLDGDAIEKLSQSELLQDSNTIPFGLLEEAVRTIDRGRQSNEWMTHLDKGRASLVSGFGIQSANQNLAAAAFFAEQTILSPPRTRIAETAVRLSYFTAALVALSLDFVMADHAFRSVEDRRQVIMDGLRFGQSESVPAVDTVMAAIALARQYADNGAAVAKQIEVGFYSDADRIPAEILADYMARVSGTNTVFTVGRELEAASMLVKLPSFDGLSAEAKAFLGSLLDFNAIAREKFAEASGAAPELSLQARKGQEPRENGTLFPSVERK